MGRLTDGQGNVVDFKNTVIILTSNLGTAVAAEIEERSIAKANKVELIRMAVLDEVKSRFRPEFINRLDEMVIFHRLEREHMHAIVDIQLRGLASRLAQRNLTIDVDDQAKDLLVETGWDPQYGARPLRRAVQRLVENPLAQRLLAGDFSTGDAIAVAANGEALTFTKRVLN